MGFPMAEAYLFCEISTESHEIAPMTPSALFTIASLGGLFACVVLCLICSECYSRCRNRHAYQGITQSSSGEHELPTAVPSSIRYLRSEPCAIPKPPLSYSEVERDRRSLLHVRQLQSRRPHQSIVRRTPSYDQVVSELDRRIISHAHQPRSRGTSGSTIRRSPMHDQLISELDRRAMSLNQPQSCRNSESMARTKLSRSTSFEVVIEQGQQATRYPPESAGQAIQVEEPEPTSSGNQYQVRITDTPPSLFEQVVQESAQYGLPTPSPNCKTMPQIYKEVRRAVQAEDAEPVSSHRSLQPAAQVTPPQSPSVDQAVRESDCQEVLQVDRSQSDRTHQCTAREVSARSPSFDQVIQAPHQATPDVHQSTRQLPAFPVFQLAASSAFQPSSPASQVVERILARISHESENSSLDYDRYSVLTNSGQAESFEDSYLRRMYALERDLKLTPPPSYFSALHTPPPSYSDLMMRGQFESPPIQYSPTWARYRPAFLRIESPPSTSSAHFSEEDPLQFYMSMSSKSNEEEAKSDIESSTEAKGAVGGARSKSTKPDTKGAVARIKAEERFLQAKIAATWAIMKEDASKMTDETTEVEQAIPETKDAASRIEAELPMPKTEGDMPSTESKYALPKTKGRPAPASTETEWAHLKPRGATSGTESELAMPKTEGDMPSTESKYALPKTKVRPAPANTVTERVHSKPRGGTSRTESELPMPKTEDAMPSTESKYALPETKGRPAPARTETEWAHSKPRGATATIEADYGMPKTDDAVASTEKELSMLETKSSRTRKYTELVTLKTKGATGTIDTDWVFPKPEGATARMETEWPMLETEGATARTEKERERPKIEGALMTEAEGTIAKSSDRMFKDPTESSDSTDGLDTVPISTDSYATGGARPKVLTKSPKKEKSKSKRKNKKK